MRAEIDAILAELAQQGARTPAAMPLMQDVSSAAADEPADSGATCAAESGIEGSAIGRGMPSEAEAASEQPIATDQPIASDLVTVAGELEPATIAAQAFEGEDRVADEVTANATTEADFTATEAAASTDVTATAAPATDFVPAGDVPAPEASQHAAIAPTEAATAALGQATAKAAEGPAPAAAAAAGDALTDGAQVIGIDARARKQKGSLAAGAPALTTTRSRPGRRLATKVAACIIALLAAATLLAVVDRAALGSVPQPTWLPPLPSYAPAVVNWSLLGPKPATGQSDPADPADAGVARPRPFAHENPLLRRYLEIWPAGS